jgi:predicted DNA-binding transcriptional regulator YafY
LKVKRANRQSAIVARLRADSPECLPARKLAERFGVSTRTIIRDVAELRQTGVPIQLDPGGYRLGESGLDSAEKVRRAINQALLRRQVLLVEYVDGHGVVTTREVEPSICLGGRGGHWYLVAWCRLREDVRVFRLDRILAAGVTGERFPEPGRERLTELAGAFSSV